MKMFKYGVQDASFLHTVRLLPTLSAFYLMSLYLSQLVHLQLEFIKFNQINRGLSPIIKRIKLPDAIIWATAQTNHRILITRNTKDFAKNEPGVMIPYHL